MRFKCMILGHDWELLQERSRAEIDRNVANLLDQLGKGEYRPYSVDLDLLQYKHCLTCGKTVDQIEVYQRQRTEQMKTLIERFGVDALVPRKFRLPSVVSPPPPKWSE